MLMLQYVNQQVLIGLEASQVCHSSIIALDAYSCSMYCYT